MKCLFIGTIEQWDDFVTLNRSNAVCRTRESMILNNDESWKLVNICNLSMLRGLRFDKVKTTKNISINNLIDFIIPSLICGNFEIEWID